MTKSTEKKQKKGHNKKDVKPDQIIGNPAFEYSGRPTDYSNIRDIGHSTGSPESESRQGRAGNHKHLDSEKDQNKAGHVRNQSDEEQTASDNINKNASRPIKKKSGVEGKTMVKNIGMNRLEGQQEGGNHGGGNAANKTYGNQTQTNSARHVAHSQDGDYKGHKN